MKKINRIFLLLVVFIFLSTYNHKEINLTVKKKSFFKIENIVITNTFFVNKKKIKKKLNKIYNKNIFLIKSSDIENPLKGIDFLEKISVKKKYPNTIILKVYETEPIAIIYKNNTKYFLDNSSNLIFYKDSLNLKGLPSVFGKDAENNFLQFYKKLKKNNFPNKQIQKFYYFQIGRWDLQLKNLQVIKFPHNKTDNAIIKTIELLNRKDFKNYKIIDLRVDGKIIVE